MYWWQILEHSKRYWPDTETVGIENDHNQSLIPCNHFNWFSWLRAASHKTQIPVVELTKIISGRWQNLKIICISQNDLKNILSHLIFVLHCYQVMVNSVWLIHVIKFQWISIKSQFYTICGTVIGYLTLKFCVLRGNSHAWNERGNKELN